MNWLDLKTSLINLNHKLLFIITITILLIFSSCGLPVYEVLEPPVRYNPGNYKVGFQTPDDDLIDGYIIYYKIYYTGDTTIDTDKAHFNASYYDNDTLESGISIPEDLDFFKIGFINSSRNDIFPHIQHKESDTDIVIDFTNVIAQDTDPQIFLDATDYNEMVDNGTPARGVLYSDIDFYNTSEISYKRFVKNFEFENSAGEIDDDLLTMKSAHGNSLSGIGSIKIAFVAISYGISESTFEQLMSIPVYLGTVDANFYENSTDQPVLN